MKRGVGLLGLVAAVVPWAGVVSAALLLGGCAQTGEDMAAGEIPTASDESEARRRARIRMELAVGYFEQGKTAVALDELKQVIAADPTFSDAYNLRGLIHMRLNDAAQAEENFKRAVSLNSRDASAIHNLGWLYCQQRRFPEANRSFDQALANPLYGDRPKTLMAKGLCQAQAGQPAEAEKSLASALRARRRQPDHRLQPGLAAVQAGRIPALAVPDPPPEQQPARQCRNAVAGRESGARAGRPAGHEPARRPAQAPLPAVARGRGPRSGDFR